MSAFWSQFSGIVIGSFFTLLGIWFTNFLSNKKLEKDKKAEILENFQQCVSTYFECIALMRAADNLASFYSQLVVCQVPNHADFHKEESQRWVGEVAATNQNLIKAKSEFHRLYMSFKIHFKKDDVFKDLINDFLKKIEFDVQNYVNIFDVNELVRIRDVNTQVIRNVMKDVYSPKMQKILSYLDGVISQTK
jgi:hypothetical protein